MFAACTPFRLLAKLVYCGALPRARPLWACQPNPGGAEETRTPDPLRAKEVLSQLSYGPPGSRLPPGAAHSPGDGGGPWWTRTTDLGLIRTAL